MLAVGACRPGPHPHHRHNPHPSDVVSFSDRGGGFQGEARGGEGGNEQLGGRLDQGKHQVGMQLCRNVDIINIQTMIAILFDNLGNIVYTWMEMGAGL